MTRRRDSILPMSARPVTILTLCALVLSGCASAISIPAYSPALDTPALRALKSTAGIADCPTSSAPATGNLPNATLPCLGGGRSVHLASLRGPMVINLWNSGCAPCRAEMPLLEAFARKYAGHVAVLGVDYEYVQPQADLLFAKSVGATYPQVADLTPVIRTVATPTTILIDSAGTVAYQQPIAMTSLAELEQLVRAHLGVKL